MTAFVLDASAAAAYHMPDEAAEPVLVELIEGDRAFVAPWLLWAEFRNVLVIRMRRGAIDRSGVEPILAGFRGLDLDDDAEPDGERTMSPAHAHGLTVCDALYPELALRRGAGLLTLDRRPAAAAAAEGVGVP